MRGGRFQNSLVGPWFIAMEAKAKKCITIALNCRDQKMKIYKTIPKTQKGDDASAESQTTDSEKSRFLF